MSQNELQVQEISLKDYFIPLTTIKAIHLIIIVGLIVFSNMLFNGFVWDDKTYIILNSEIHSLNIISLFKENLFNMSGQYRPIPAVYFATIYAIFKDTSFFYHIFQLAIHIANASLLFILFKKFFNKYLSLLLSLIFLVHPIQVESVSYIAATGSPLFFFFGMLALFLSMKDEISTKRLTVIFTLVLLSILVRETGILFLMIVIIYRFLVFRKNFKTFFIAATLTAVTYFAIRFGIGGIFFAKLELVPIARLSFIERLMNVPAIILHYIALFLFPYQLVIEQVWTVQVIDLSRFYFPLIIDILFFSLLFFLGLYVLKVNKRHFLTFSFFFMWFIVGLGFHAQIFPLDWTVADRWFYFPMVGLLGMIGAVIQIIRFSDKRIKDVAYIIAVIIIMLLSLRTMVRNANWSDARTLYSHDIKVSDNFDIENNLGGEYGFFDKNYDEGLKHFKKSVEFFSYEDNIYNVGYMYEMKGEMQNAKEYYSKALKAKNYSAKMHKHNLNTYERLGQLLVVTEKPEVARDFAKEGLNDYPDSGSLWLVLAVSEYYLHNQEKALDAASKGKLFFPGPQSDYVFIQITNKQPIKILTGT